jgi:hypothetical protein
MAVAMLMGMGMIVIVQMLVGVGMVMLVSMLMAVLVAMGMAIVGVLMGMGMVVGVAVTAAADMVMMLMHKTTSKSFFLHYKRRKGQCQTISFFGDIPPPGLQEGEIWSIMCKKDKEGLENGAFPRP